MSTISPVIASKIPASTSIVQSPFDVEQLAKQATILYQSGKFQEAAKMWQQTAVVFAAKGDKLNQAMALGNLSLTYQKLGDWDKAKKTIEDSLELLKIQPQGKEKLQIEAQALDILGNLQRESGQSADALKTWQKATKIYSQTQEKEKLAQSRINQAEAMLDLGLYPRACKTLLETINKQIEINSCQELRKLTPDEISKKLNAIDNRSPSLSMIVALRSLGELLRFDGELEQALVVLRISQNLAQKLDSSQSKQEQAATYISLGNTSRDIAKETFAIGEIQEFEVKALQFYTEAIHLASSPITRQQAQLHKLISLLSFEKIEIQESERLQQSAELWQAVKPQLTRLSPSHTGLYRQINLVNSLIELIEKGKYTPQTNSQLPTFNDIEQIATAVVKQARSLGDKRAEAYALGNLGRFYLISQIEDLPRAENLTKESLRIVSNYDAPDITYQLFRHMGQIRKKRGDIPDAIAAYNKAYDALQSLSRDLVALNPELLFSFQNSVEPVVEPVYRELIELNLEYSKSLKTNPQKSQELLSQTRDIIESLQLAELNNFFRETCLENNPIVEIQSVSPKPLSLEKLDQKTAIIYTFVFHNRLEVLLGLPKQTNLIHSTTTIVEEEFQKTLEELQRSLLDPLINEEYAKKNYQKLYEWLIKPIKQELEKAKVTTLAFVLDENLRSIPMGVLHDGKNYLLENYAIAITPGLQLTTPKPLSEISLKAFTAGLSKIRDDLDAHKDFKPLNQVQYELEQIKTIGISDRLILNDQFTSKQLVKQILASGIPPIVHFATHGEFSSQADKTFILSWDKRIDVRELGNILRDYTLYQTRPIELLVLSACKTASGDKRATLGLAGVAVRAGARSTLATLWSVVDDATAELMAEFYRELKQAKTTTLNKAEVLRNAQLAIIKKYAITTNQEQKIYTHPHFWAPFVLVGNWQ